MRSRAVKYHGRLISLLTLFSLSTGVLWAQGGSAASHRPAGYDSIRGVSAEYAIQVGAFTRHENAFRLTNRLQTVGFHPVTYENLLDGKTTLHLVWVGRYLKPADAEEDLKKIEELTGVKGVLRERMVWKKPKR